ncbi:MAG TPA: hypothetical protein VFV72_11075 [Candidatus Limnocylindrales bacterium]|nr:hypothetical protein [Candidatus Limnocylindrales bacterium]
MPALEPIRLIHVVADPAALDAAPWVDDEVVLRIAADEALVGGGSAAVVDDPDAIVVDEVGFSAATLDDGALAQLLGHVEFQLPPERPALVQGKIAGVPAKLHVGEPTLLVVQTAYADELRSLLGW